MIKYKIGDITEAKENIICHQVNCQGEMNSGVAKAIREKWPVVYNKYITHCKILPDEKLLGEIQIISLSYKDIVNMFSQNLYGYNGKQYTSYDSFMNCLSQIKFNYDPQSEFTTIAFPYKIGCVRGGASWSIIQKMIETEMENYYITFYCINPNEIDEEDKEKFEND